MILPPRNRALTLKKGFDMPNNHLDLVTKVDVAMSLLRCADNALLSGDDCSQDVVATHSVVASLLKEIKAEIKPA